MNPNSIPFITNRQKAIEKAAALILLRKPFSNTTGNYKGSTGLPPMERGKGSNWLNKNSMKELERLQELGHLEYVITLYNTPLSALVKPGGNYLEWRTAEHSDLTNWSTTTAKYFGVTRRIIDIVEKLIC